MLYYDRIDLSEGIEVSKSSKSKEFMVCHYWYFCHRIIFKQSVCKGCHDVLQ